MGIDHSPLRCWGAENNSRVRRHGVLQLCARVSRVRTAVEQRGRRKRKYGLMLEPKSVAKWESAKIIG